MIELQQYEVHMALDDHWSTLSKSCSFLAKRSRSFEPDDNGLDMLEVRMKRAKVTNETVTDPKLLNGNISDTHAQHHIAQQGDVTPTPATTTTADTPTWKSFVISTRNEAFQKSNYSHINEVLHNAHITRYGDPETQVNKLQQDANDSSEQGLAYDYNHINAVLRQAFLQRHGYDDQIR